MNQLSYVLFFVYGVNSLAKDFIRMSDETDSLSKDSFGESAEKYLNNNIIEIKTKNQSAENKIPHSSCSSSLENITDDHEMKKIAWKKINAKTNWPKIKNISKIEESDHDSMYPGKILSSDEETKSLWEEIATDNDVYQIEDKRYTSNKPKIVSPHEPHTDLPEQKMRNIDKPESQLKPTTLEIQNDIQVYPDLANHFEYIESLVEAEADNGTTNQGMQVENENSKTSIDAPENKKGNLRMQNENVKTESSIETESGNKTLNQGMRENNPKIETLIEESENETMDYVTQTESQKMETLIEESENETTNQGMQTENKKIETWNEESQNETTNQGMQTENENNNTLIEVSGNETTYRGMQIENETGIKRAYQKDISYPDDNEQPIEKPVDPDTDEYQTIQELDKDYIDEETPCPLARIAQMQALLLENIHQEKSSNPQASGYEHKNQTGTNNTQTIQIVENINLEKFKKFVAPNTKTSTQRNMRPQRQLSNSPTILAAPTNSTIEVSDHKYQENRAAEESDDDGALADYPYSVSIQRKGAHYATGALVAERWVLSTAAEFFTVRETIKLFRMRLGSVDCKKGGMIIPLKSIAIYPGFIPGKPSYDVSVLGMASAVPMSNVIKPIGLSRVAGKVMSAKFLTTYWPRIVVKKGVVPPSAKERVKFNSMRVSTQKLVPSDECSKMLATVNVTLASPSLCLKAVKVHHSDCMPDVGAPVVAVDGLWGITSGWISPLCPAKPLPTVFTRVSAPDVRTWIEEQMAL